MPSKNEPDLAHEGQLIKDRWQVIRKLGGGGFGQIYEVFDVHTREILAMKAESNHTPKQVLKMEVAVLKKLQNQVHISKFYGCGRQPNFNYVVMTLQGKNLADLRKEVPSQCFSLSTTFRLLRQMITCIQVVHDVGFLHRDVKPSNFAIGNNRDTCKTVYVLDFGLARLYLNSNDEVRSPRKIAGFRGTVRYASLAAHQNQELGRADDFWSLFYLTVEFSCGQLPWRKLTDKEQVGKLKLKTDHSQLIRHLPGEFQHFLAHIQNLSYFDRPDYDMLRAVIDKILCKRCYYMDDPYDWEDAQRISTKTNRHNAAGFQIARSATGGKQTNKNQAKYISINRSVISGLTFAIQEDIPNDITRLSRSRRTENIDEPNHPVKGKKLET